MAQRPAADGGLTMLFLRAWMWAVPVAMFVAAVVFGVIAVVDGRWALFGVMILLGLVACGLMLLHWWLLYRFGKGPQA